MVSPSTFLTAATLVSGTFASPVRDAESSAQPLEARAWGDVPTAAGIVRDILKAIGVFTKDDKKNAWDFKANKDMCEVFMKTVDGGDCSVSVECQEGGKREYYDDKQWENCRVQGREFFDDPRIGKFSVEFTKRDGDEGEGLTNPVLQVENVGNWKEWDITGMAYAYSHAQDCKAGIAPLRCHKGPWVCRWVEGGNTPIQSDRSKRWSCGVPKRGAKFPDGLNWEDGWSN